MIYLIGGAPRVGKTILASRILARNNISCLSTDVIRNFLEHSPSKIGVLDLEEADRPKAFAPYFFQLLRILQKKYPNYVIEGDIFTPEQVASLQEAITLKCCFLGSSNITLEDITQIDPSPNWVKKLLPEEQVEVPERVMLRSVFFKTEAAHHNFPYFDIYPNRDMALESAYAFLIGKENS